MKKLWIPFLLICLIFTASSAQTCADGNSGSGLPAARFANGGQIYLEWSTTAAAQTVFGLLNSTGSIDLDGTADATGAAINVSLPFSDLVNPGGNPFRIRSNTIIENNGGQFTGLVTFNFDDGSSLVCEYSLGNLPISLTGFRANTAGKSVWLEWETASEYNSDFVVLERSANAYDFTEIGRLSAAGFSDASLYYSLEDKNPLKGDNYYRLRQVDFDGTQYYSQIVHLLFGDVQNKQLQVYPSLIDNSTDLVNVDLSNLPEKNVTLQLYNGNGYMVQQYQSYGAEELLLPTIELPKGLYILKVQHADLLLTGKFIKNQ